MRGSLAGISSRVNRLAARMGLLAGQSAARVAAMSDDELRSRMMGLIVKAIGPVEEFGSHEQMTEAFFAATNAPRTCTSSVAAVVREHWDRVKHP